MIRHDLSKPPAYAYLPFRLPKQKEPAIGGLISSVEINCEFLTMDGWQIEGEQSSFGHDGCGGREYAKHLVLTTDLLRESRGSCHSRHAFPHIRCIIQARKLAFWRRSGECIGSRLATKFFRSELAVGLASPTAPIKSPSGIPIPATPRNAPSS